MNWGPHPYQLPWQYFLYIFRLFIAVFAPFHLLSDTLYKQGFRIFHVCLWLVMWSETLAALEFSVLKQHCSRPRKWSNLNQAVLNRLSTLGRYQAIIAPPSTMRSDFDRKYCTIHQICSVGNSCEKVILRYRLLPQVSIFKLSYPNTFTKLEIWVPFACLS